MIDEADNLKTKNYYSTSSNPAENVSENIDPISQRFPYCIVWTPLPLISWFIPFIGHTGICSGNGTIHDFAGSETIGINDLAFGETHKYVYLKPTDLEKSIWDNGVNLSDKKFSRECHNIFTNNCHSHVAHALNSINYNGYSSYNMIHIWWLCLTKSKYVSWFHIFKTYIGFVIIIIFYIILLRQ